MLNGRAIAKRRRNDVAAGEGGDGSSKKTTKQKLCSGSSSPTTTVGGSGSRGTTVTGICDHVSDRYEKVGRVGQGTYGVVYKAHDKQTGEFVALKRCLPHHESTDGFPLTTIRELHTLRMGRPHPNIVKLLNVAVSSTNNVFLVFEFCAYDVAQLLDAHYAKYGESPFQEAHVKTLSRQLWSALEFLHERAVIHRDIKSSNLLYHRGTLKLADFGLARQYDTIHSSPMTPNVVSLWYRAPELLWKIEATTYTTAIDMWASGCVVAELILGVPLLDGKDEVEQMGKIVSCFGHPPSSYGPRVCVAGDDSEKKRSGMELTDRLMNYTSDKGLRLLYALMDYDVHRRWTAEQALTSEFFTVNPLPSRDMPTEFRY